MKNNNQEVKKLPNGDVEVTISFDITKNGHKLGLPRNYNVSKVQKLIRSKDVQHHIKSGYALGLYGHGNRDKKNPLVAKEKNPMGEDIEPICKTVKLSIKGNIITHTQRIVANEWGKKVMRLLDSGFGGFSFVWDLTNEKFGGADYVLSPNFNGNRVLVESICSDGACKLDSVMDSIVTEALDGVNVDEAIFDDVKDLLLHNHSNQEILLLKKKFGSMKDEYKKSIDELGKKQTRLKYLNETMAKKIKNLEFNEDTLEEEVEVLKWQVSQLEEAASKEKVKLDSISESKEETAAKYDALIEQIKDNGLEVVGDSIEFTSNALGGIMLGQYPQDIPKIDMDAMKQTIKKDDGMNIDFSKFPLFKR